MGGEKNMMDYDIEVSPMWLETLMALRRKDIGQIQPKILFPFQKRIYSAEILPKLIRNGYLDIDTDDKYSYVKEGDLLAGECGLYNSKILKNIKQDENFKGCSYNDLDFSLNIKKDGFKLLYCGEAEVIKHSFFKSTDINARNYFKAKWNLGE